MEALVGILLRAFSVIVESLITFALPSFEALVQELPPLPQLPQLPPLPNPFQVAASRQRVT